MIVELGTYMYDRPSKRFYRYLNVQTNVTIYILKEQLGDPPPSMLELTATYYDDENESMTDKATHLIARSDDSTTLCGQPFNSHGQVNRNAYPNVLAVAAYTPGRVARAVVYCAECESIYDREGGET